jgi:hypothetical protein
MKQTRGEVLSDDCPSRDFEIGTPTVAVLYRELYNVTYDKEDKTKVIKKELIDLDFLDAQIITK